MGCRLGPRPAIETTFDRDRSHPQPSIEIPQGRPDTLFDHRVIEWAVEHLLNGEIGLGRPTEEVCQMFGCRTYHLGT